LTRPGTEQRKLAAILSTDMVGDDALSQLNETLASELLEEDRGGLRGLFPKHPGTEIKTAGDGFLVEFASAVADRRRDDRCAAARNCLRDSLLRVLRIPGQIGHPFRFNSDSDSNSNRTPVPIEIGQ
jgi:class 3 adenylate cyclase